MQTFAKVSLIATLMIAFPAMAAAGVIKPLALALTGQKIYTFGDVEAQAIGTIKDLSVDAQGTVTGVILDLESSSGAQQVVLDINQTFLDSSEGSILAWISAADAQKMRIGVDTTVKTFTEYVEANGVPEQVDTTNLIVKASGEYAPTQLTELLLKMREQYGESAFPLKGYQVQKGETYCSIFANEVGIGSANSCPKQATLGNLLNGSPVDKLLPGQIVKVPALKVDSAPYSLYVGNELSSTTEYQVQMAIDGLVARGTIETIVPYVEATDLVGYTSQSGIGAKSLQSSSWRPLPTEQDACQAPTNSDGAYAGSTAGPPRERSFYYLFDWLEDVWQPSDTLMQCAFKCSEEANRANSACVDLILVDSVPHQSGDLGKFSVISPNGLSRELAAEPPSQDCRVEPFRKDADHGSHLAGILASRANGEGYVGFAPGLDLLSFKWDKSVGIAELDQLVANRKENFTETGPQIYVFASQFPSAVSGLHSYPKAYLNGDYLKEAENADGHALIRSVRDSRQQAMWIVSAMQADESAGIPDALKITDALGFAPANLGHRFDNVIVVTACIKCGDKDAALMENAFFGDANVQIAAPGFEIVGPVGPGRFSSASGTSQATAIVAGIAGAMANCFRNSYQDTNSEASFNVRRLKQRLLYTARPVFRDDDLNKVGTGVVDPIAALLDPEKDWFKQDGRDYTEIEVDHWCTDRLSLFDREGAVETPFTKNLLRMVRVASRDGEERPFVLYSIFPTRQTLVERWAPRFLQSPKGETPVLKLKNGDMLTANQFDDLILKKVYGSGPCND